MRKRMSRFLTEEQKVRRKEYMDLRTRVQELREKVEPIKHAHRMNRLMAEVEKLTRFLERNAQTTQQAHQDHAGAIAVFRGWDDEPIKAADPSIHEKDCGCIECTFWTKPHLPAPIKTELPIRKSVVCPGCCNKFGQKTYNGLLYCNTCYSRISKLNLAPIKAAEECKCNRIDCNECCERIDHENDVFMKDGVFFETPINPESPEVASAVTDPIKADTRVEKSDGPAKNCNRGQCCGPTCYCWLDLSP